MKKVVIAGAGFGGLRAAQALAGKGLEVLLIDRNNYHLFHPLLYQVATASLEQESIAYPIRALTRNWDGVNFRLAEVCGVDFEQKKLLLADDAVDYDYLVIAAGTVANYFGMESIERHSFDLKQLNHAVGLRNQILGSFERASREPDLEKRKALLTFVIVGGGPTGVEFAGALQELIYHVLDKDYPELVGTEKRIVLIEATDRLLAPFPPDLRQYTVEQLTSMGVEVLFNAKVTGAEPDRVLMADGTVIPSHTLFWCAGVSAVPLAARISSNRAANGRIPVTQYLSLPDHPEVFVIGDLAYLEQDGAPLTMTAPVAMQEGEYVGKVISRKAQDAPVAPFRFRDKGSMATIGRSSAVAYVFGRKFAGHFAWLVWLGLHLLYLVGFRNRLMVLLNWSYYYFLYERQVRLLTREGEGGVCR